MVLVWSAFAAAQKNHWLVSGFSGQSIIVFGSADSRVTNGVGLAYSFGRQARLRMGEHPGELITEVYYDLSKSNGVKNFPANTTSAWGFLTYARYRWRPKSAPASFLDIGWGLQDASRTSRDLVSKLNSTPFVDFGIVVGQDHERAFVGARLLHISNANTVDHNRGQNQIYLLIQLPL